MKSSSNFVDEVTIHVVSGAGGNGCVGFRREKFVPFGGPDGGDGGRGGDIVLIADRNYSTLLDFRYRRHYKAPRGEDGRSKDQYGHGGDDLILRVPAGTVVYDADSEELLGDLTEEGTRLVLAEGGKGGRGNIHFSTPWNQAPRQSEDGTKGGERHLRFELKLLADVGLLGYPSVGSEGVTAFERVTVHDFGMDGEENIDCLLQHIVKERERGELGGLYQLGGIGEAHVRDLVLFTGFVPATSDFFVRRFLARSFARSAAS